MGRSKFVFDLLMKTWPLGKVVNWLGSRPLLGPRSQFSAEENEAVIIPVEEKDGRAHISERCKGCGRCVATCPSGAITLHVADDFDVLGHLWAQIEQRTNIRPGQLD